MAQNLPDPDRRLVAAYAGPARLLGGDLGESLGLGVGELAQPEADPRFIEDLPPGKVAR